MITEDDVKRTVHRHLIRRRFADVRLRLGRANGIDVEGVDPTSGKRIAVECKGETNGADQRDVAWRNASEALFAAIRTIELHESSDTIALAFLDTENYRRRMRGLEAFCARQGIQVFWVKETGRVTTWRSKSTPNFRLQRPAPRVARRRR